MTDDVQFPDRHGNDDFLWLEDIYGEKPLDWVTEQNARTMATFDTSALHASRDDILDVLDSDARIPYVDKHGDWFYNFWRDEAHPKGIWRRTTLGSFTTDSPDWEIVLDLDALAADDGKEWVWHGAQFLRPENRLTLLNLSPDGGDAIEIREFDVEKQSFVENGFHAPYAKGHAEWADENTLLITTVTEPATETTSSYPRQARVWARGQKLADAPVVHEIPADHMGLWCYRDDTPGFERSFLNDKRDFFHGTLSLLRDGEPVTIDIPDDANASFHREWMTVELKTDWTVSGETFVAGSLIATTFDAFMNGDARWHAIFTPDDTTSFRDATWTQHHLLLSTMKDIQVQIDVLTPSDGEWTRQPLGAVAPNTTSSVWPVDDHTSDDFWMDSAGFLSPSRLSMGSVGGGEPRVLKSLPPLFDDAAFEVEQHFATSKDGTRVPYFQIAPKDSPTDRSTPTILTGYGGFQLSLLPGYNGVSGRGWLARGGALLIANLRGGGEYGPAWHHAAMRDQRHRAYEDFAAVAEDAVRRGLTSPEHLGCMGGSNGGLLVGNMLTHYPELFGAIVCQVPLLDMKRYTKLSAGYSWIAEYGDPESPDDWAFIQTFSPYHNLREGVDYPPILLYTATSDDRVGPVQARKMGARMQQRGIPDVLFYENRLGGHGGAAANAERAFMFAMSYEFLWQHLA